MMDARPQRLRTHHAMGIVGNENAVPKQTLHQRHKSAGNLSLIPHSGSLKAAAKRTAFGDLSNTAKNLSLLDDGSQKPYAGPKGNKENIVNIAGKSVKDAFLRPAQRSVALGVRVAPSGQSRADGHPIRDAASEGAESRAATVKAVSEKPAILHDSLLGKENYATDIHHFPVLPNESSAASNSNKDVGRQPRHSKSQPQLKNAQPILRRTQSRHMGRVADCAGFQLAIEDVTEALYEDAVEEQPMDPQLQVDQTHAEVQLPEGDAADAVSKAEWAELEELLSRPLNPEISLEPAANRPQSLVIVPKPAETLEVSGPVSASLSMEPEEYWDDEADSEYDPGYTTAHSIRSKTGEVTTYAFPTISNSDRLEMEAAQFWVMSHRTQEEIDEDCWDISMVAEYGEEIFDYMKTLEMKMLPSHAYMDMQTEMQWSMRAVLMDWLVQVHDRFNLLPETLFLTVNYIDRFLSVKIISIGKLQLVGATALLIASKYEEINCPSLQEIVYMVDGGYTVEEILKAERFMLSMLQFELGWPGPMSFLRRVSKADDYDLETRTLAKYFLEVSIMDERFVGSPASFLAAGAHCLARYMLKKGTWTQGHVHYSGYTYKQLKPLLDMLLECCESPLSHHLAIFDKYADKKYKKASEFVQAEMEKGFILPDVYLPTCHRHIDAAPLRIPPMLERPLVA